MTPAMYTPPAFHPADNEIAAMLSRAPLACLIAKTPDGLRAAHLPMIHDADAGTLTGHVARGNPLAAAEGEALAVFQGPYAYISPSFYASKAEHGRVVPTWNYEAVHVHGVLSTFQDEDRLRAVVSDLTDVFEAGRPLPWRLDDAPGPYVQSQLRGITGVEVRITRVDAARKLSQNRALPDRTGVIAGLRETPDPGSHAIAALMQDLIEE